MAKKEIEYYEYKEAPMRKAYAYASFGWLIGKHSQHYSKKLDREVVTLRRDNQQAVQEGQFDLRKVQGDNQIGPIYVGYYVAVMMAEKGLTLEEVYAKL